LKGLGLRDVTYLDKLAVRIPYPDDEGQEVAVRFRVSLDGPEKFRWRSGNQPLPYGLRLLGEARAAGFVVLVERAIATLCGSTRYRPWVFLVRPTGEMGGRHIWTV
jgi:hypothetical protein